MSYDLRPYQVEGIDRIRQAMLAGYHRILAVAPTGSGKTVLAAEMIARAVSRGQMVFFLAHRQELIDQTSKKLDGIGVPHGVIQGSHPRWAPHLPVQVASVPTVARRQIAFPKGLIFVDECHRAQSASYLQILQRSPDSFVVGLTATPCRTDGKGLGDIFEVLIEIAKPADLIDAGYLLRPRIFAPEQPDLDGIKTVAGDFDSHQLGLRMDNAKLVGNVAEHWGRLVGRGRRAVVFATSVAHSQHLVAALEGAGASAAHLDAKTPSTERKQILEDLARGALDVVSNVGILTEGWDLPCLSAVILARPTQSESLHLQMLGRVMRTDAGKDSAIAIDHAGNVYRHGFPWEDRIWSLFVKTKREKTDPQVKTCLNCYAMVPSNASVCPECGSGFGTGPAEVQKEADGNLIEITGADWAPPSTPAGPTPWPPTPFPPPAPAPRGGRVAIGSSRPVALDEVRQYLEWSAEGQQKGFAPGYAAVRFKQRYGRWPSKQITGSAPVATQR